MYPSHGRVQSGFPRNRREGPWPAGYLHHINSGCCLYCQLAPAAAGLRQSMATFGALLGSAIAGLAFRWACTHSTAPLPAQGTIVQPFRHFISRIPLNGLCSWSMYPQGSPWLCTLRSAASRSVAAAQLPAKRSVS